MRSFAALSVQGLGASGGLSFLSRQEREEKEAGLRTIELIAPAIKAMVLKNPLARTWGSKEECFGWVKKPSP